MAGNHDGFEIEVAVRSAESFLGDAMDADLFDQLPGIGIEGVEPVDLVVLGFVGGGVAQDEERVELLERVRGFLALHLLRFIENEDRMVCLDYVDGAA